MLLDGTSKPGLTARSARAGFSGASNGGAARLRGAPLMPVRGAVSLLNLDEDQVLDLIEEGELLWAFDCAIEPGGRKHLRILPDCIFDFQSGRKCRLKWPDVLHLVLPHERPVILAKELRHALNVSEPHVTNLTQRKLLTLAPGSRPRRGPNGSPQIVTASLIRFLAKRCYPCPVDL